MLTEINKLYKGKELTFNKVMAILNGFLIVFYQRKKEKINFNHKRITPKLIICFFLFDKNFERYFTNKFAKMSNEKCNIKK